MILNNFLPKLDYNDPKWSPISVLFILMMVFFWCGSFFKDFIEFAAILLLFYVFGFWLQGIWDLSFLTRDWTCTFCTGRWSFNHWTAREVLQWPSRHEKMIQPPGIWCFEYHSHCLLLLPVSLDFLCLTPVT